MNQLMALLRVFFAAFVLVGLASRSIGQDKGEMKYEAKLLHKLPLETYSFPELKETKDGLMLAVALRAKIDAPFDAVSYWDVPANKEVRRVERAGQFQGLGQGKLFASETPWLDGRISPDGTKLVIPTYHSLGGYAAGQGLFLHEFASNKATLQLPIRVASPIRGFLFLPDGDLIVVAEGMVYLQKIGAAKPRLAFKAPTGKPNPGFPWLITADLSPDASKLAVCQGGVVSVFDVKTGKSILELPRAAAASKNSSVPQNKLFTSMAFVGTAENPMLLTVDHDADEKKDFVNARVIDLKTKKVISKKILAEGPANVEVSPFNKMRTRTFKWGGSSREGCPFADAKSQPRVLLDGKIFDPMSGDVLGEIDSGRGARISRDGKYIVRLANVPGDEKKNGIEIWGFSGSQK